MRISTSTIYDQGVAGIELQQSDLLKTQQQLSTGNRILTPSDDPIAAAQALQVGEASATNDQYTTNRSNANTALGTEDNVLQSITNVIQSIRTNVVSAGNASMTGSDLATIATTLTGQFQQLMGLANSTDGEGQYLFSGYQGGTQPFTGAVGSVTYNGDQGSRTVQAAAGRQIAVSDSGFTVFQNVKSGNGIFTTSSGAGNTGSGTISVGSVTGTPSGTPAAVNIVFTDATHYQIQDPATGQPATGTSASYTYTPGADITYNGWTVQVSGTPAAGDTFTVAPSTSQSLFTTLSDIITALKQPASGAAGDAQLTNALGAGLANIDQALNNVLTVRASVGTRMQELSSLDSLGSDTKLQDQKTLSQLTNVDYTQAASDLTLEQTYLTAAQKSFTAITGLSLFNYL